MNNFVYDIPTKVYFGENQLCHLGDELKAFGKKVLLVYGGGSVKKTGLYDRVIAELCKAGLESFELGGIEPNPRIDSVRKGATLCKQEKIDAILAVGGGSVIDAAKFIGAGLLRRRSVGSVHGQGKNHRVSSYRDGAHPFRNGQRNGCGGGHLQS